MDSEDGQAFVKKLAYYVRTHERALANALQRSKNDQPQATGGAASTSASSSSVSLAQALQRPYLSFSTQAKSAKLALTPHHLYYLLTKFEDLGVDVGAMGVRLENIHTSNAPNNYVSFLGNAPKSRGRQADSESLRSISSVRSVMSSMSSMWSAMSLTNSAAKAEKQMAQYKDDIRYLYSCFTKIPTLRLTPDHRAPLISGFEEFPFDTAVPLYAFKNVSTLEICDLDFRQFFGWDRLADQLRSLTVRRAGVDDPIDLLLNIVLDDMDKRRRRSSKAPVPTTPSTPGLSWSSASPRGKYAELARSFSTPTSPLIDERRRSYAGSPQSFGIQKSMNNDMIKYAGPKARQRTPSPRRELSSRHGSLRRSRRTGTPTQHRRSSGSSDSSTHASPRHSTTDLHLNMLPSSKWRFLRHLSLAENGLTTLSALSFLPVADTLHSLDVSGNLFTDVPDALASLTNLRALNLSNCMIESLSSLSRSPLPAITVLNLRSNRLFSLAGIERLLSLERIDVRDNRLRDDTELARLTGMPNIADLYVHKNPFTRTHSNYRVTIFNLFRSTPGHLQDVTIDSLGPTSNERKYLVDRVPEPAIVPVIEPEREQETAASAHHSARPTLQVTQQDLEHSLRTSGSVSHSHRRTISDMGPQVSPRKKRVPRRRVVELSQQEAPTSPQRSPLLQSRPLPQLVELPPRPESESEEPLTPSATPYHTAPSTQLPMTGTPTRPVLETAFSTPTPAPRIHDPSDDDTEVDSSVQSPHEVDPTTDMYKQKLETLKSDFGPNWLTALNEDRLVEQGSRERTLSPTSRTPTVRPDQPARGVSVSERQLG